MKQMSKEELISLFLEHLKDNNILGCWMSKEEIRQKLDNIIENVTYYPEKKNTMASWRIHENNNGKGTVNFDLNKISDNEQNVIIVHELLHALWTTISKEKNKSIVKCGLKFDETYNNDDKDTYIENISVNEGLTDIIAERITGITHNGYHTEKDIYKILSIIIGENNLLDAAFSSNIETRPSNIFSNCLMIRYGNELGQELNDALRKVLKLSDQFTTLETNDTIFGINDDSKKIQNDIKDEIFNTLKQMLEKVIDNEKDFEKKVDIIIQSFQTIFGYKFSGKALSELDSMNLSAYDKLKYYIELSEDHASTEFIESTCQLYFQTGKISEKQFNKRNAFSKIMSDSKANKKIKTVEDLNNLFESVKYRKIGNYYEIEYDSNSIFPNPVIVDSQGNIEDFSVISKNPFENGELTRLDRYNISKIDSNVDELWVKIKNFCLSEKGDSSNTECQVYVIGKNMVRFQYFDETDKSQIMTYTVDSNGEFTLAEVGPERRFTDDTSQLERQISDVSITDILQEVNDLQTTLNNQNKTPIESVKGEDIDGK